MMVNARALPAPCRTGFALLLVALLAACASYVPAPLDKTPALKPALADLRCGGSALPPVLGVKDVVRLALENDPDLVAARAQAHVADAQVLAAGILPNPSFTGNYGFLLGGPGTVGAIAGGLSADVTSLVTFSVRRRAANATAAQINAAILWQEWQVIGKARLLVVDLVEGDKSHALLRRMLGLMQQRLARARIALAQGNTTLKTVAPDIAAVGDLRRQLDALDRQQAAQRQALNALLGLRADVPVPLAAHLDLPEIAPAAVAELAASLADRRPDLVALQLGYRAEEARVRGAILAQFPALLLGVASSRDNSNVWAAGPQITLALPVFDRNQGNIAVARATRAQLRAAFRARLAAAAGEIEALVANRTLVQRQLARARPQAAALAAIASRAAAAYAAERLDERSYVDLAIAALAKRQEIAALRQSLLEQRVALATLIGAGMPPVRLPPAAVGS